MKAKYHDLLHTNDDIRPLLAAKNRFLVAIQPINEDIVPYNYNGREYGIFVLNSEYRKLGSLLGRIAVIHPVIKRAFEGDNDEEEGKRDSP